MMPYIDGLQRICNVTDAERKTIEKEELGIPMPKGLTEAPIEPFPTPGRVIKRVLDKDRKRMLIRLYAEYEHLSSYVHGLPEAITFKEIFGKYKDRFPTGKTKDLFQKEIVGPPISLSWLAVVQSATELTCLYPQNIELTAAVAEAWNKLLNHWLIAKVVWEIRARKVLGSVQ